MYKTSKYNYTIPYKSRVLFFNGLKGNGFNMSHEEWNRLEKFLQNLDSFKATFPADFDRLYSLGYIVDADFDEIAYVKHKNREACYSNRDYMLIINPTLECCFRCWYCYEEHQQGHMGKAVISALRKHISSRVGKGDISSLYLSWFGGEPLLYFDEIVYPTSLFAMKQCNKNHLPFGNGITTNAYCIDGEMVEKMNKIKLSNFQITLDGHRERHDTIRNQNGSPSYDRIIENIHLLCAGIDNVRINLRINYDDVTLGMNPEGILKSFDEAYRKFICIDLHRVWQTADSKQAQSYANGRNDKLNDFMAKASSLGYECHCGGKMQIGAFYNCYAGRNYYACINYDGNVFKCTARSFTEANRVGKLQKDGSIVWDERKISRLYGYAPLEKPECEQCDYLPVCMGPCPQNYMEAGYKVHCVYKNKERSINDRITDLYEASLKHKKQ